MPSLSFTSPGAPNRLSSDPHRPSLFSAGFVPASRRLGSSHDSFRPKQRGWDSSLFRQDSLGDYAVSDGTLDDTQASLILVDEEVRQHADRHTKRLRQLQAREARQRSLLVDEERQQFDNLTSLHRTYSAIADTCVALRHSQEAKKQHHAQQSKRWSQLLVADAMADLVLQEELSRRSLLHAETAVRETTLRLQRAEANGLASHEDVFRVVHAEQVRRAFLLREEARAVEAMRIPHFIALPCITATASPKSSWGLSKYVGPNFWREVDKIDLMAAERCPFRCAADCPYVPASTRELGRAWAVASAKAARSGRAARATDGPRRRNITEVGKQRVLCAAAKSHLREATTFLPSLRVGI
ncbi:hypothetical protein ABB37_00031 [Leptomonas pyrrhocoris]|uniref:Uncharacterized protein n=1 Tax=Leptomonas pyrrhocoris TaxID=157538 RepID=A0A0M9G9P2_LEPPY|nr:hypothetical protein ABB37_00031 [Leptomonas pyrrhocoris]XP_015664067.1 hypothetical protein ABB37_00031 [Leptomonas pyrrhocoris]KPA85627.1 hypothetical protein ABB37_00031 [Leptomonas pyrrhocoris]KPA85628.1 hypothetical protein ABB37_00031 [Leptomonas pyrrhocoris]|eukprot:XP_015664066.1 hypothetical protein ABB37_00031 [Leptomonas pyrrhocoris]